MLTETYPQLKGCVFVATYGRSGSTVLQRALQLVPGAHVVGENHNALHPLFLSAERARKTKRLRGAEPRAQDEPWFGADRVRPAAYEAALVEAFVRNVLRPPRDVRWLGFKEIRFHRLDGTFEDYMAFHRRAFPNALLVFNTRGEDAVAASKFFANRPGERVRGMVREMDDAFGAYAAAHPDHSILLRHEDWSGRPEALAPLFAMMGETPDPEALRQVFAKRLTHG